MEKTIHLPRVLRDVWTDIAAMLSLKAVWQQKTIHTSVSRQQLQSKGKLPLQSYTNPYICKKLTLSHKSRYATKFFYFRERVASKIGRVGLKGYIERASTF